MSEYSRGDYIMYELRVHKKHTHVELIIMIWECSSIVALHSSSV